MDPKKEITNGVLTIIKSKISKLHRSAKWKKLFILAGDSISSPPDQEKSFAEDIKQIFSRRNMINLAKETEHERGYNFRQAIHNGLYRLFYNNEIEEHAETYIRPFLEYIVEHLKKYDPDKYQEFITSDWQMVNSKKLEKIEEGTKTIIRTLTKGENTGKYSIKNIDAEIKEKAKM